MAQVISLLMYRIIYLLREWTKMTVVATKTPQNDVKTIELLDMYPCVHGYMNRYKTQHLNIITPVYIVCPDMFVEKCRIFECK